ncbi:hypothetical protein J3D55_001926 [Chryseobacterium ginsenosidimutans]|uniref:DUF3298 domain-containing protein n=1 Tax=Chryseobacterium ginsenosidimutans TaxID=687846 RepID=UPI002168EA65|nr:DUF3298 domain-containing protein [Chryseobacterium ginsenosidimutans]MCS3869010.1 hypothetical protein [Chryseobacterium ginsenosidimutans]
MKRLHFIWIITLLAIIFACKEIGSKKENSTPDAYTKLIIDSVIKEDSTKLSDSVMVKYSSKLLLFPNFENKKLLKQIYADKNITNFSKEGLQKFLTDEKKNLYNQLRKSQKYSDTKRKQQWEYTSQMNLKMNKNDYLYIQYYYNQFEGESKDQYRYQEKVFDLINNKKLQLSDILSISKEDLSELLKANLEKTTMMQQMKKYDEKGYAALSKVSIPMTGNFYFDDNNLYFHYNMNEIGKNFDIGDIVIPISWEDLKANLKTDFKERMKIN